MTASSIYLDYNATTPVHSEVLEKMLPYFTIRFGNASSTSHPWGWNAAEGVAFAREQVAQLIGAEPSEIIFTSGATEAINLALKGTFETYHAFRNHLVVITTEHAAVLDSCQALQKQGAQITYVPVLQDGTINLDVLSAAVTEKTLLVCVMMANNETGVLQPLQEVAAIAHGKGAFLFSDTTQAIGKLRLDVNEACIDLCCISAHKMHGPKGVGALYVRRKNPRINLTPIMDGGGHENGRRSGTLNVPGIVGLGAAAELAMRDWWEDAQRMSVLRTKLEQHLIDLGNVSVNGNTKFRLPNTSNICFQGFSAATLLRILTGIGVSTGSACASALGHPSHVLLAMGRTIEDANSSLRISIGKFTTAHEITLVADAFERALKN